MKIARFGNVNESSAVVGRYRDVLDPRYWLQAVGVFEAWKLGVVVHVTA